jgi:hypothetical protein
MKTAIATSLIVLAVSICSDAANASSLKLDNLIAGGCGLQDCKTSVYGATIIGGMCVSTFLLGRLQN